MKKNKLIKFLSVTVLATSTIFATTLADNSNVAHAKTTDPNTANVLNYKSVKAYPVHIKQGLLYSSQTLVHGKSTAKYRHSNFTAVASLNVEKANGKKANYIKVKKGNISGYVWHGNVVKGKVSNKTTGSVTAKNAKTNGAKKGARQATGYHYSVSKSKLVGLKNMPKSGSTLWRIVRGERTNDGANQYFGANNDVHTVVKNYRIVGTNMKIKPGTHMYSKYIPDGIAGYEQVQLFKLSNGNTAVYDVSSPKHSYEIIDNPKDIYTNNTGHYVFYLSDQLKWKVDKDGFVVSEFPKGFKALGDVFQGKFSFRQSPYDQTGNGDSLVGYNKNHILLANKSEFQADYKASK